METKEKAVPFPRASSYAPRDTPAKRPNRALVDTLGLFVETMHIGTACMVFVAVCALCITHDGYQPCLAFLTVMIIVAASTDYAWKWLRDRLDDPMRVQSLLALELGKCVGAFLERAADGAECLFNKNATVAGMVRNVLAKEGANRIVFVVFVMHDGSRSGVYTRADAERIWPSFDWNSNNATVHKLFRRADKTNIRIKEDVTGAHDVEIHMTAYSARYAIDAFAPLLAPETPENFAQRIVNAIVDGHEPIDTL